MRLESHKRRPVSHGDGANRELTGIERGELARKLGEGVDHSGDIEIQAEAKRRLQRRMKPVPARRAGHAPPCGRRIAFRREPLPGRARQRVAADHVAAEAPQVALLLLALMLCVAAAPAVAVRIKDISVLRGVSDSQLVGYGLVVGLQGSGDTLRNAPFTEQSIQAMLEHLGLDVHGASLRNRNVASVIVTTDLAAGMEAGARLDVTVSALGDAPSLMGGTLLLTQLQSADGVVHASAQGAVSVTGFETAGQGETLSQGVPTAGRIPNGAIVEHEVPASPDELRSMLELKNPDYATAVRIVDAINAYSRERFRAHAAYEVDSRTVELFRPRNVSFARFIAEVGELQVEPDMAARVVLDARTGTVVVGQDVQISTVAVTYGTLTVRVAEQPRVSQPAPFSQGKTIVTPNTRIDVEQGGGPIAIVGGSSLRALVTGLNRIGVKPPGIIAILQAIKTAGALQADLVIQ
jgi:flagellar P-ring protein precursor FlgI